MCKCDRVGLIVLAAVVSTFDGGCSKNAAAPDDDGGEDALSLDGAPADARPAAACPPPGESSCGNPASLIQGVVSLPGSSAENASGTLIIALMHRRYGDPQLGGHPHWFWTFPEVDLSEEGFAFEIDMCDGNAIMWSEENCEYNLIALLDTNGNNGPGASRYLVPDPGEPASMQVFDLSCHASAPTCLSVDLDCVDGGECISYDEPASCECAENACQSEASICKL